MGMHLLAGALGILLFTLYNMQSVKNKYKLANERDKFSAIEYCKDEWIGFAISVTIILLLALNLKDLITYKPMLEQYIRTIFTAVGILGSWAFGKLLGAAQKKINKIIDIKTDIADGKLELHNDDK